MILGNCILEVTTFPFSIHSILDKCLSVFDTTICSPIYFLLLNRFLKVCSFQTDLSDLGGNTFSFCR